MNIRIDFPITRSAVRLISLQDKDLIESLTFAYTFAYTSVMVTVQANGFDWDQGNRSKCQKHGLSIAAIESLFTRPIAIFPDERHSRKEKRYRAVGQTSAGRYVFIVFTLRRKESGVLIRPISARYMHKKEVTAYEKENPDLQE